MTEDTSTVAKADTCTTPTGAQIDDRSVKQSATSPAHREPTPPQPESRSLPEPESKYNRVFFDLKHILEAFEKEYVTGTDLAQLRKDLDICEHCNCYDEKLLSHTNKVVQKMWQTEKSHEHTSNALNLLASLLRDPGWRIPFADAGILKTCLIMIERSSHHEVDNRLLRAALRVVANCVADTDCNRRLVLDGNYTESIIKVLGAPGLADFAVPALFNLCNDCEPAQVRLAEEGLANALAPLAARKDGFRADITGYYAKLLEFSSAQSNAADDAVLEALIQVAFLPDLDIDDYLTVTNALINFLKNEKLRIAFVDRDAIAVTARLIRRETIERFDDDSPEDKELLNRNCLELISALSDCCDISRFSDSYLSRSANSTSVQPLSLILSDDPNLELLGCIVLGNLARSELGSQALIHENVHSGLLDLIRRSHEARILHGAIGALKNLAIPRITREDLGESGAIEVVSKVWTLDVMPEVQLQSVSLVRLLVTNSIDNVANHLLAVLSDDASSHPEKQKTYLSLLFSLCEKTDTVPIKFEIGRVVAAIVRTLSSPSSYKVELDHLWERIYKQHTSFTEPLKMMLAQLQYPALRSEAIFAMALMARRNDGCEALKASLRSRDVRDILDETVRGKGGDSKDRDNAVVLASELLKNGGEGIAFTAKEKLEEIIKGEKAAEMID